MAPVNAPKDPASVRKVSVTAEIHAATVLMDRVNVLKYRATVLMDRVNAWRETVNEIAGIAGDLGRIRFRILKAGNYLTDAGAAFGVLPRAIWDNWVDTDDKHRIRLDLNLLLLLEEGKVILVDTGIGNRVSARTAKIHEPSAPCVFQALESAGFTRHQVDFVVMTHLHFDHAGGIISRIDDRDELSFPNAYHVIQKSEWETALNPDEVNKGAYDFDHHLSLLEKSGKFLLVEGDFPLTRSVTLKHFGGHSNGFQAVRIENEGELGWYAGDLAPTRFNLRIPITSAYDVHRAQTCEAKATIFNELNEFKGVLLMDHDPQEALIRFPLPEK